MTNEEFEREIKRLEERIEDQINSLRIKLLESKADKKPYEVEVPEEINHLAYLDEDGYCIPLEDYEYKNKKNIYIRGLAFETREQAEHYDKKRILINKMKDWAKKHNGDWTPDWKDDDETIHEIQIDRFPMYSCDSPLVINEVDEVRSVSIFPYFYSYETAREFIEEFRGEIEEVFC